MTIERIRVKSTNVASVGFDDQTPTLEVEFQPRRIGEEGVVYRYTPDAPLGHTFVCQAYFERLTSGKESVGRLVHAMIASRTVACERVFTTDAF